MCAALPARRRRANLELERRRVGDRVGLVEKISAYISRCGCNIEDSRMAVFYGEFAIIVLISGEGRGLSKIVGNYRELEAESGLSIGVKTPAPRKPASWRNASATRAPPRPLVRTASSCGARRRTHSWRSVRGSRAEDFLPAYVRSCTLTGRIADFAERARMTHLRHWPPNLP